MDNTIKMGDYLPLTKRMNNNSSQGVLSRVTRHLSLHVYLYSYTSIPLYTHGHKALFLWQITIVYSKFNRIIRGWCAKLIDVLILTLNYYIQKTVCIVCR